MKTYSTELVEVKGKKYRAVYVEDELEDTFDTSKENWIQDHNSCIERLRKKGYKTEKEVS